MQLLESFKSLGSITGIANMVKEPLENVNCVENFLHMYGAIIMFLVCLLMIMQVLFANPSSKIYRIGVSFVRHFITPLTILLTIKINKQQ